MPVVAGTTGAAGAGADPAEKAPGPGNAPEKCPAAAAQRLRPGL